MKKRVMASLVLAVVLAAPFTVGAAYFGNRLGASNSEVSLRGTALKDGKLVDFGREVWGRGMTVEVQHVQGEEAWCLHI